MAITALRVIRFIKYRSHYIGRFYFYITLTICDSGVSKNMFISKRDLVAQTFINKCVDFLLF